MVAAAWSTWLRGDEMREQRSISIYLEHPWTLVGGNLEAQAVLLREGVHHGSAGPIYWAAHVLKAAAPAWEGATVTLNHPLGPDGNPVSVNSTPEIRAKYAIGKVVRPHFDAGSKAIKATLQIWADHPMAANVQKLKEVSVGVYANETETYGAWNGENYRACAVKMEVDHLAILDKGQVGACSFEKDGCGIRVNSAADDGHLHILSLRPWPKPDDCQGEGVFPPEVM